MSVIEPDFVDQIRRRFLFLGDTRQRKQVGRKFAVAGDCRIDRHAAPDRILEVRIRVDMLGFLADQPFDQLQCIGLVRRILGEHDN
jgi:hypothetical protein